MLTFRNPLILQALVSLFVQTGENGTDFVHVKVDALSVNSVFLSSYGLDFSSSAQNSNVIETRQFPESLWLARTCARL